MTSSPLLDIQTEHQDGAILLVVTGEVDLSSVHTLRDAIEAASTRRGTGEAVVVDLTDVGFLGSAGLAVLAEYHEVLPLRLVLSEGPVRRALEISAMDRVLDVYDTRAAAMRPAR